MWIHLVTLAASSHALGCGAATGLAAPRRMAQPIAMLLSAFR